MLNSQDCYSDLVKVHKPDFIIHTACPFMEGMRLDLYSHQIRAYSESSKNLVEAASEIRAKKLVATGAASSIVGNTPQTEVYNNPLVWADHELISKPNEKAKLLAERTMWNTVTKL